MRPGPVAPTVEDRPERKKHNHGRMYRCKIVPFSGKTEYGEWLDTGKKVQAVVSHLVRTIGTRYYCEMKTITCSGCEADERTRVVSAL